MSNSPEGQNYDLSVAKTPPPEIDEDEEIQNKRLLKRKRSSNDKAQGEGLPEDIAKVEDRENEDDKEDDDDEDDNVDDEDDDEDDAEADEEETHVGKRKRARKERRNQFLDVEAEVDEEEEEEDEEDYMVGDDGFIQEQDVDNEELDRDDRHHRNLDRQRQEISEKDAEELAQEYREKYGRSSSRYRGDTSQVAQRLLLPSVTDASIWAIKCKPGKEQAILHNIASLSASLANTKTPLQIISAFYRDSLKGYIYVEARKSAQVADAVKDVINVYASKLILVPIQEMPDLLRVKQQDVDLTPGAYVRIKAKGKYVGDLAQVVEVGEDAVYAQIRIVPRLDFSTKEEVLTPDGKKKKRQMPLSFRPPARLFNESEAIKFAGHRSVVRDGTRVIYSGEEFQDGYLVKNYQVRSFVSKGVNPTLEEITKFAAGSESSEGLDLSSLAAGLKAASKSSSFEPGDVVEIFEGEQTGVYGIVTGIINDIVTLTGSNAGLEGQSLEVPSRSLRKRFKNGDHVKVTVGRYKGEIGMVVRIFDDQVTILSDASMKEVTVFSKDLSEASQSSDGVSGAQYELHDVVQLDVNTVACVVKVDREAFQVLDQNGTLRTVLPRQVSIKHDFRRAVATDRDGSEIRVGDTVKEVQGETRQGTILHIHRSFAFLYNRELTENYGVFVSRIVNLAAIATKSGTSNSGPDLNKLNPAIQQRNMTAMGPPVIRTSGRDRTIGQTVTIRQGPHKGLMGIIKDTTDETARVELHSKLITVTVEKTKLSFKNSHNGQSMSYAEFLNRGKGAVGSTPMVPVSTPAWSSSRTPVHGGGGRTPVWAGGGSRTPAWTGNAGSRTPVWGGLDGGRTPAWGSRTPVWSGAASGSRTPARHDHGNRTPAKGSAWEGGQTPRRRENGSDRITAKGSTFWEDAATKTATPGVWNAPTPGSYDVETPAYTPANFSGGTYESAQTPAASPGFTGGYGPAPKTPTANDVATPGYVPASP